MTILMGRGSRASGVTGDLPLGLKHRYNIRRSLFGLVAKGEALLSTQLS